MLVTILTVGVQVLTCVLCAAMLGIGAWIVKHAKEHQQLKDFVIEAREDAEDNKQDHKEFRKDIRYIRSGVDRISGFLSTHMNGGSPLE